jgi:hypothetical protein
MPEPHPDNPTPGSLAALFEPHRDLDVPHPEPTGLVIEEDVRNVGTATWLAEQAPAGLPRAYDIAIVYCANKDVFPREVIAAFAEAVRSNAEEVAADIPPDMDSEDRERLMEDRRFVKEMMIDGALRLGRDDAALLMVDLWPDDVLREDAVIDPDDWHEDEDFVRTDLIDGRHHPDAERLEELREAYAPELSANNKVRWLLWIARNDVDEVLPRIEAELGKLPPDSVMHDIALTSLLGQYTRRHRYHDAARAIFEYASDTNDAMDMLEVVAKTAHAAGYSEAVGGMVVHIPDRREQIAFLAMQPTWRMEIAAEKCEQEGDQPSEIAHVAANETS